MCSVKSQAMISKAVGTGMIVNRADTLTETNSSSFPRCTDVRYWLKPLLSLTNTGVIPVCFWRILVRNLANWYVTVNTQRLWVRWGS